MNKKGAIYCNNCYYYRDDIKLYQVLGSIDQYGRLIIKRPHNLNTVMCGTATFTVTCECGYMKEVTIISPSTKQLGL